MQTFHLKVDEDGRVTIPDTRPGQVVTVQLPEITELPTVNADTECRGPIPKAERAVIKERIQQLAHEIRREMGRDDERLSLTHGDLLYDEHGLPK